MSRKKGQSELISIILITGIIIALVTTAYFWGNPLIQEQQEFNHLNEMQNIMFELRDRIKDTARTGGSTKVQANLPADMTFVSEDEYTEFPSINMFLDTQSQLIPTGDDIIAVSGETDEDGEINDTARINEESGVITLTADPTNGNYINMIQLYFRNQTIDDDTISKIHPVFVGDTSRAYQGNNIEIEMVADEIIETGDMYVRKVNVSMEAR